MTTWDALLTALQSAGLDPKQRGSHWRMKSPFRAGSDSDSFVMTVEPDGEHGTAHDKVSDAGYSLYQVAAHMGVELPKHGERPAANTVRVYKNLAEFAAEHGAPEAPFVTAGWKLVQQFCGERGKEAPALEFPTSGGKRYRFLDGLKPKYISPGFKACWYGLQRAVELASRAGTGALVLCNGEASTIVAQHFGIPAACVPGGERRLPDDLLKAFHEQWNGDVWLAYDCDDTGKRVAKEIQAQFKALNVSAYILDLGLTEHGDLADLCRLYGSQTFEHLKTLVPVNVDPIVSSAAVAQAAMDRYADVMRGEPLILPFKVFHRLGGFARVIPPGKVVIIAGTSGGGKTAFLECLAESWLQWGKRGLWDGKEWTAEEYHSRRIQRITGITLEQQLLYEVWKREYGMDIPPEQRMGIELSLAQEKAYLSASADITRWAGCLEYMPNLPCLEETLDAMTERIIYRRRRNEAITFAIFDYMQLYNSRDETTTLNPLEHNLDLIKNWTIRNQVIGIVGTQVTKSSTSKTRHAGQALDSTDAMYIRDDKANLMITLNPQFEDDPATPGEKRLTNRVIARVAKNSAGKTGNVRLLTIWERLMFLDKEWHTERVDLGDL